MRIKFVTICVLFPVACVLVTVYFCNKIISDYAKGKLYSDVSVIPFSNVGLLLGTSKLLSNGQPNPYYAFRIQATVKLINAHKIKYILISGDNARKGYDEPTSMRSDLISAGVDSSILYLDYAGFRTFDSIKRLKEIFGQNEVTIISQKFHNERAIYIAKREGIEAYGFNATDVSSNLDIKTHIREKFARVKVFLDYWLGKKPRYLGNKVSIPS